MVQDIKFNSSVQCEQGEVAPMTPNGTSRLI